MIIDPYREHLRRDTKDTRRVEWLDAWLICPGSLSPSIEPHAVQIQQRVKARVWRGATCKRCGVQINSWGELWALDTDGRPLLSASEADAERLIAAWIAAKTRLGQGA